MFGSVTNAAGVLSVPINTITYRISGGNPIEVVNVPSTFVTVNGQCFYLARVPFESRSAGSTTFGHTPNVLGLTSTPTAYSRSAMLGTNTCAFVNPQQASFSFSKANRGKIERVNLSVSIPTTALDSDGDGVPDWAELIAGTDPHDPKSVFRLSTDLHPAPAGGLVLEWSSVPGKTYSIFSTTNLTSGFTLLSANVPSSGVNTTFTDLTATGLGPFFYRITVNN